MQKKTKNSSLINSLQSLYAKIAMMIVQIRSRTDHFFTPPEVTFDINLVLSRRIAELARSNAEEDKCQNTVAGTNQCSDAKNGITDSDDSLAGRIKHVSEIKTEFSKYIQEHSSSQSAHPCMAEKLKTSAWEHIHSAVRLARLGDNSTADLHANIASHALEEAGHFLSHREYANLVSQIEQYFTDSQKEENREV